MGLRLIIAPTSSASAQSFMLLTGRRAFTGDTPADIMTAIRKATPPDLADSGRAVLAVLCASSSAASTSSRRTLSVDE